MIGYVTVGTNDLPRAVAFYDALFKEIGANRFLEMDRGVAWSVAPDQPGFGVMKPFDGKEATIGNGCMTALAMDKPEKVDAFYKKAMELGGTDEGEPGERMQGFYAAYFRDPDGNKLNCFCITQAG